MVKYLLFRYLRFDRSQPFIALCSILAFVGVSIGLMVLIIAMGIMNGFDKEFERKLFAMNYPLTIVSSFRAGVSDEFVSELEGRFSHFKLSPYISTQAVLKNEDKMEGAFIFGIDPAREIHVNSVFAKSLEGREQSFDGFEIIVGQGLRSEFGLMDGDKVMAVFIEASPAGLGINPTIKRFNLKGSFNSGLIAYDKGYAYTSADALRRVLGHEGGWDGVHIYSNDPKNDIKELKAVLPAGYRVFGWWEQNGNFFSALELEKRALFIVLMLIILVASLNIISSLLMTVMNRRSEIALLLALGASKKEVANSFFAQGLVIGGGGIVCGLILGLFGVWLLGSFDIVSLPADVYGSSKLPMELGLWDLFYTLIGASVIVALSSWYPAKKAAKIDVLSTLRNE